MFVSVTVCGRGFQKSPIWGIVNATERIRRGMETLVGAMNSLLRLSRVVVCAIHHFLNGTTVCSQFTYTRWVKSGTPEGMSRPCRGASRLFPWSTPLGRCIRNFFSFSFFAPLKWEDLFPYIQGLEFWN